MNRSLVVTPMIALLCSIVGCRAQDERRELKNSITRLEQKLEATDRYLNNLQKETSVARDAHLQELRQKDAEISKLRGVIERQEAELKRQHEELERELRAREEQFRRASEAHQKDRQRTEEKAHEAVRNLEHRLQEAQRHAETERARHEDAQQRFERRLHELEGQLAKTTAARDELAAKLEHTQRREHESRDRAIEQLRRERQAVEKLRAAIEKEIVAAHRSREHREAAVVAKLKFQNAKLEKELVVLREKLESTVAKSGKATARAPREPSDGAHEVEGQTVTGVGTLIIHAEDGTVNVHIHGGTPPAPKVTQKATPKAPKAPRRAMRMHRPRRSGKGHGAAKKIN
ncbi:MAG TPA: hypothetical protein ENI87_04960 [bacterium]|nr:hypothetical protein [bacterium]